MTRYTLYDVDRMRELISTIYGPKVYVEDMLRTYILAGIDPGELVYKLETEGRPGGQ